MGDGKDEVRPDVYADLGILLVCSVRYALGLSSYIVADVCRIVRRSAAMTPAGDLGVIRRDVRAYLGLADAAGPGGDAPGVDEHWRALLRWLDGRAGEVRGG